MYVPGMQSKVEIQGPYLGADGAFSLNFRMLRA